MKRLFKTALLLLCLSGLATSCENKKSNLEGYEWLEGKWTLYNDWVMLQQGINITPSSFQYFEEMADEPMPVDFSDIKPIPYTIQVVHHEGTGSELKAICSDGVDGPNPIAFIDEENQCLYDFYDFDQRIRYDKEGQGQSAEGKQVNEDKPKVAKSGGSSNSLEKAFVDAFDEEGFLCFEEGEWEEVGYRHEEFLYLHPFTYSNNKLRGKVYTLQIAWRYNGYTQTEEGTILCVGNGDFEFENGHLRLFSLHENKNCLNDKIYQVSTDGGRIVLIGPAFEARNYSGRMTQTSSDEDLVNVVYKYKEF